MWKQQGRHSLQLPEPERVVFLGTALFLGPFLARPPQAGSVKGGALGAPGGGASRGGALGAEEGEAGAGLG